MTDGAIDQVSQTLGRMEAQIGALTIGLNTLNDNVSKRMTTLEVHQEKLREDHDRLKNRGLGIVAGIGLATGSLGASIKTWILPLLSSK